MEARNFKIFVDFDGTVITKDVGDSLWGLFGKEAAAQEEIQLWREGILSSKSLWERLFSMLDNFNQSVFEDFLADIDLTPGFREFVKYCEKNSMELTILSDGFDYYIRRILNKEGLSEVQSISNRLLFQDNRLKPVFPQTDEECTKCANCKRNGIISGSSDDDFTFYVGDGFSDHCPATHCDFIFAKDSLLKYCDLNRISYYPYRDFFDVLLRVKSLAEKKNLKKRHQAYLKRKAVYALG